MNKAILSATMLAVLLTGCTVAAPEQAAPAPTVTVTEAPAVTDDPGYELTQVFLETAWDEQDNPRAICLAWAIDRDKWLGKFVGIAVDQGTADADVAEAAVTDFFDGKCGV